VLVSFILYSLADACICTIIYANQEVAYSDWTHPNTCMQTHSQIRIDKHT
jgi:hypothetical protein